MDILLHYFNINTIFFVIWDYPMSYLEFFWTIFNIFSVYLVARNKILNRPIGILWVILYIFLFYQIQLYSDLWEQIYFLITGFYGRYLRSHYWNQKQSDDNISYINNKTRLYYIMAIVAWTLWLSYITSNLHIRFPSLFIEPASYVILDAFTTTLSFAATILMIRQKIECRLLWIIVDIIGIYLYYIKWVKFIAVEYIIFLWLATNWLFQWIKLYKKY
jgi:nicotinamide mononucleotide transporter